METFYYIRKEVEKKKKRKEVVMFTYEIHSS